MPNNKVDFSEIQVLNSKLLGGLINRVPPLNLPGAALMPDKQYGMDEIEFDAIFGGYPIAPYIDPSNAAPILNPTSVTNYKIKLPSIRFLIEQFKAKLYARRAYGSLDAAAKSQLNTDILNARNICDITKEVAKFNALKGAWTYTSTLTAYKFSIDYNFTATHKVSFGQNGDSHTVWSDTTNADPLKDILEYAALVKADGGAERVQVWMNSATLTNLVNNAKVRTMMTALPMATPSMRGRVAAYLLDEGIELKIHDTIYTSEAGVSTKVIANGDVFYTGSNAMVPNVGEFAMSPNEYTDEAALFVYPYETENPKRTNILAGFTGMPAIHYPDLCAYTKTY